MSAVPATVVRSAPSSSGLYDVLDLILDKGLVIDAYVRVSVIGIEILTVDLRVVIASVDTYLRFAEAVDRLYLHEQGGKGLDDLMNGSNGSSKKKKSRSSDDGDDRRALNSGDDDDDVGAIRTGVRKVKEKVSRNGSDDDDE